MVYRCKHCLDPISPPGEFKLIHKAQPYADWSKPLDPDVRIDCSIRCLNEEGYYIDDEV